MMKNERKFSACINLSAICCKPECYELHLLLRTSGISNDQLLYLQQGDVVKVIINNLPPSYSGIQVF
jgi:hypothetical protein